jgi:hypothetical protein
MSLERLEELETTSARSSDGRHDQDGPREDGPMSKGIMAAFVGSQNTMRLERLGAMMICATLLLSIALSTFAAARDWKKTPESAAMDYLMITDMRSNEDIVMVWWLAPESLPATTAQVVKDFLSQYLVLGVNHVLMSTLGAPSSVEESLPELTSYSGASLRHIPTSKLAPSLQAGVAALTVSIQAITGPMGAGMKWYVFGGSGIESCEKGGVSVSYAGERYTYDTPIPGCPGL